MNVGDLVEYVGTHSYGKMARDLGTIVRVDPWYREGEYYIVWHTTDNEGWWSGKILKLVSKNENR
jgi:hypothetical protein